MARVGGTWTSVLENIIWGAKIHLSAFLIQLKATTQYDKLSIYINAFGYYYNHAPDGRFSMGRIVGCVGPFLAQEPATFAPCRRLYGIAQDKTNKAVFLSNTNFLFEKEKKRLTVDLGDCFPISDALGNISLNKELFLAVSEKAINQNPSTIPVVVTNNDIAIIGEVNYQAGPNWLNQTGGIISYNNLSEEKLNLLEKIQLLLLCPSTSDSYFVIARESTMGFLVRADNFVNRVDYGEVKMVNFYAYQYGQPLKNVPNVISLEPATPVIPKGADNPICEIPGTNYPADGFSKMQLFYC